MFKKQITDRTYLLNENGIPCGIVNIFDDKIVFMNNEDRLELPGWDALEEYFGKISEQKTIVKQQLYVKDFPIKSNHEIAAVIDDPDLPLYTNIENGVVFIAGFWAIKTVNNRMWQRVQSPKLTTVENNEALGPYKTRMEVEHVISQKNKK